MAETAVKNDLNLTKDCPVSSTGQAYKTALGLITDAYRKGMILQAFSGKKSPLASFELLALPILPVNKRKLIVLRFLKSGKIFDITTTGVLSWALIQTLRDYNSQERIALEKYFEKCEEYFDAHINADELLEISGASWMPETQRAGVLVETQALYAKILDLLSLLTHDDMYVFKKKRLARAVQMKLDGAYVLDRPDSLEVRPNVFLAAFFAPEIFSRSEWEKTFDSFLKENKLWLKWGGFGTLSKLEKQYNSMRDGNSWFFLNNIAAISLYRFNSQKYGKYARQILKASTQNIFWQQHAGRPCEVVLTEGKQIKVQGLYGISAATFVYLSRMLRTCSESHRKK